MEIVNVLSFLEEHPEATFLDFVSFNGKSFGTVAFTGKNPGWEMHPDTDEFFYIMEGEAEITLLDEGGPHHHVAPAGSSFVIPKGSGTNPRRQKAPSSSISLRGSLCSPMPKILGRNERSDPPRGCCQRQSSASGSGGGSRECDESQPNPPDTDKNHVESASSSLALLWYELWYYPRDQLFYMSSGGGGGSRTRVRQHSVFGSTCVASSIALAPSTTRRTGCRWAIP